MAFVLVNCFSARSCRKYVYRAFSGVRMISSANTTNAGLTALRRGGAMAFDCRVLVAEIERFTVPFLTRDYLEAPLP